MSRLLRIALLPLFLLCHALAGKILIPMDLTQTNHLKAYGIAYYSLAQGHKLEWLLNYHGGSFLLDDEDAFRREAVRRGVLFEALDNDDVEHIHRVIETSNMETISLEKAPKMAVYTPLTKQPWDDAVTLAMAYAEIPYDKVYDREILSGKLAQYDWIHLHHEDFTGQYSKFLVSFNGSEWYMNQVKTQTALANELGFPNDAMLKKAVSLGIRDYVEKGGFLFAMCLAPMTLDMALAGVHTDVVGVPFDGSPPAPDYKQKIDYDLTLAFKDFGYDTDPLSASLGDLDYNQANQGPLRRRPANDFTLFAFSPKFDPVPAMLVQNHTDVVKGFFGLATSFPNSMIKPSVTLLGQSVEQQSVRYLHGNLGKGQFTYYGGHDPEDYTHAVGDKPTDLDLCKNSAGYRLILNNMLYPAARQKKHKT